MSPRPARPVSRRCIQRAFCPTKSAKPKGPARVPQAEELQVQNLLSGWRPTVWLYSCPQSLAVFELEKPAQSVPAWRRALFFMKVQRKALPTSHERRKSVQRWPSLGGSGDRGVSSLAKRSTLGLPRPDSLHSRSTGGCRPALSVRPRLPQDVYRIEKQFRPTPHRRPV
jgi:hypothetical protein